jgi:hypothetical protein
MKKIVLMSYLLLPFIISCSTEVEEYMDEGTITGYDTRECSCCGGFFIDIGNITYRFYTIPDNSSLNLENPDFPIPVKLSWKMDENACLGDEIIVLSIERK